MSTRTTTSTSQPVSQAVAASIDTMANGAEHAIQTVRDRVSPAASRLATQAEDLAHRSIDAVRDKTDQLRERASLASERGTQYVKDEPLKAVLIAAAAGALLMALVSMSRSNRRPYSD